MGVTKGLLERLKNGEYVICAEGYLFEFERRGYLKAGAFVPEVVVEHPHLVKNLHEEFVHSGSDVVEAFTYYGHREKLRIIGRDAEVEKFNMDALRIAREVADKTGTLMAGNICNTTVYKSGDEDSEKLCTETFKEQIEWAVKAKVDYIIGETFMTLGEAKIALKCIKEFAPGLPAVIMMAPSSTDKTFDGMAFPEALCQLEELGADVVGLNCFRGPDSMIPLMKEIRQKCKGPLACLPVPYRTTMEEKSMQDLKDHRTGKRAFPLELDQWLCSREHISDFTEQMKKIGVQYIGVCCGNRAYYIRSMAEAIGRKPEASRYSPDLSQHMSQIKGDRYHSDLKGWHEAFNTEVPAQ